MKISVKDASPKIEVKDLALSGGGFAKYFGDIVYVFPEKDDLTYFSAFNFTKQTPYSFSGKNLVEKIHGEITITCP